MGNLTRVIDPLNNQTNFTYNGAGQPLTATDAVGHTVQFSYDLSDLETITDPLGRVTRQFTDPLGHLLQVADPLGNKTRFEYDIMDRATKQTDALGQLTQMAYDGNSNLTQVTDPRGGVHQYGYDAKNRRSSYTDPLLKVETYLYDGNDNLTRFTDRKSQVSGNTYDALNRVTSAGFGATVANPTAYTSTTTYTLDAGNRPTQIVQTGSGTITRGYDGLDRLNFETTPQGRVDYTYDAIGRRATMTVAGQAAMGYTYDNANRLTQITQGTNSVGFTYDAASRRSTLTLPNGVVLTYGYDNADQLASILYQKGATTLGDLTYTYDGGGRRVSEGGSFARRNLPAALTSATFDAANHLTNWGGTTLPYDLNGNMTGNGTKTYTWNARNQLASISGGTSAIFQYDALGRRVSKTVGGITTQFVYDGMNPVQELNGTGTPTANLLTGLGIDEYFSRTDATGARSFLTDALGSSIALTDSTGIIQTSYTYDPYGETTASLQANSNALQYTGRENDGTGLYYYRARYYDPVLKRFISEDPIGLDGGVNTYTYVGGNPIRYTDPRGLYGLGIVGGGGGEAGAGTTGAAYQWSSGAGVFGIGNPDTPLSTGAFTSEGGMTGVANSGTSYPSGTPQSGNFVAGATAGLGGGIFFTNAKCAQQLLGPFVTINVNLPFISAQYAFDPSSGIVIGSASIGRSFLFSISKYTTTTTTASGCPCQ